MDFILYRKIGTDIKTVSRVELGEQIPGWSSYSQLTQFVFEHVHVVIVTLQ